MGMSQIIAKPSHPKEKSGDLKWDSVSKLKPGVTLNQQSLKLLDVGLSDVRL
jgi:hypothetical protein